MSNKKCNKCGLVKSIDEFHKAKRGKFGRQAQCRSCRSEYDKAKHLKAVGGKLTLKRENKIIADHGDWLEIDISTHKHPNSVMKIDKVDYEMIKSNSNYGRLFAVKNSTNIYVHLNSSECDKRKNFMVHRLIHHKWIKIDHINGDGTDNRRSNLRDGAGGVNERNTRMRKNNTSGYTGVSRYNLTNNWCARICVNYKTIKLGVFSTPEEASEAYQAAKLILDASTPSDKIPFDYTNPNYNHYLYQMTCDKNDMIYIGRHSGEDADLLNDGYTGSGTLLKEHKVKYGMKHFHKKIIQVCESYDDLVELEKEVVNQEFVDRPDTYNQQVGS